MLIASLVLILITSYGLEEFKKERLASSPQVGDVYKLRESDTGERSYTWLKVKSIAASGELTVISNHKVYTESMNRLSHGDSFDLSSQHKLSQKTLDSMMTEDVIADIYRGHKKRQMFHIER